MVRCISASRQWYGVSQRHVNGTVYLAVNNLTVSVLISASRQWYGVSQRHVNGTVYLAVNNLTVSVLISVSCQWYGVFSCKQPDSLF
jgi:hypothetical protein